MAARKAIPTNGAFLALAARFPSDEALAQHLRVPRTTLRDHIYREGLREATNAARGREEVSRPDEIPVIVRDYSKSDRHYIYPLGDVHKGSATHDQVRWQQWLNYLEGRSGTSLLGTGDFLNSALKDSKSEAYDETMTVGEAKRALRRELKPLADQGRIDLLMPGNHEDRIYRAVGDCPVRDLADSLETPYVEAAALVIYRVGKIEYEVYVRHGTGMGQSLAQLAKSGFVIKADIYITGHTHRQAVTADDYFTRDAGVDTSAVGRRKRYFVSSGSFLGYEKYAAARGYPPSRIGAPRIFLDGTAFDIHVSV
jgi:predicted phosphodiesterase